MNILLCGDEERQESIKRSIPPDHSARVCMFAIARGKSTATHECVKFKKKPTKRGGDKNVNRKCFESNLLPVRINLGLVVSVARDKTPTLESAPFPAPPRLVRCIATTQLPLPGAPPHALHRYYPREKRILDAFTRLSEPHVHPFRQRRQFSDEREMTSLTVPRWDGVRLSSASGGG
jgi:hypothetical protein